uniref:Uncharacterized protein n=1 Tax=Meloidogyne enterolobii TaxID=390850 RepID=A0A6V7UB35_MELEN|nr:unnamed protein product [Meloidogyne enterolobii]
MTKAVRNLNKYVNFVKIKNKWREINSGYSDNKCINKNKKIGRCIKVYEFGNLINDGNIKYMFKNEGILHDVVYTENSFERPQYCSNYSLYYFEIKYKSVVEFNSDDKGMSIGLKNCSTRKNIRFRAKYATIYNEKDEGFKLGNNSFNNNDILGCGVVYPPTNKMFVESPYVFFTQNGNQIGKYLRYYAFISSHSTLF